MEHFEISSRACWDYFEIVLGRFWEISKNMDSDREKVVLNPGDYVMRIQQGNSENASYEFKLIIRAKNK